ncbi:MAG: hypothetical protein AAGL66_11600, partial [Pseudomonadota bacterium]
MNRPPGRVLNCGFDSKHGPVVASHDVVCARKSELIAYDHHASEGLLLEAGLVMLIDSQGLVAACHAKSPSKLRRGEQAVSGTGDFVSILADA